MLIQRRLLNTKNHIWISGNKLAKTVFKPGTKITYRIEDGQLTILPSETGLSVARRKDKNGGIIPLIDIRRADALEAFKQADAMEMEIHDDKIIISSIKKVLSFGKEKERILRTQAISISDLKMVAGQEQYATFRNGFAATIEDAILCHGGYAKLPPRARREVPVILDALSLFAGAGMLDYAFKDKFNIVWANEFDRDAANSYALNIGSHVVCADINDVDLTTLPRVDLIIAGSPCQALSNSNRKEDARLIDNPKNLLLKRVIEAALILKPLVLVIENVPQILTAGGGKLIKEIKEALKGFSITTHKLNSADFGSAQKRERAIIICSQIGPINIKTPVLKVVRTVRDAFAGLTDDSPNQMDFSKPNKDTLERMKLIPEGGNWQSLPDHMKKKSVHSSYLRRLEYDKPSTTIVNVRKTLLMPPEGNRSLSIRECARLFGLPDSFQFTGSLAAKQQQVCNGVPVELGRAVANVVYDAIAAFKRAQSIVIKF